MENNKLVNAISVTAVLAAVLASGAMNLKFGASLGVGEIDKTIMIALSLAADALKVILPLMIAYWWATKSRIRVISASLVWVVCVLYSLTAAFGFASLNRADTASSRGAQISAHTSTSSQIKIGIDRLQAINRDLERGRNKAGRLLSYKDRIRLRTERDGITENLPALRAEMLTVPAISSADPQAETFARLTSRPEDTIKLALICLIVALSEIMSSLGVFSLWRDQAETGKSALKVPDEASQDPVKTPDHEIASINLPNLMQDNQPVEDDEETNYLLDFSEKIKPGPHSFDELKTAWDLYRKFEIECRDMPGWALANALKPYGWKKNGKGLWEKKSSLKIAA